MQYDSYESYSLNIFISILLDAVNGTPTHLIDKPIKIEPTSPAVFLQAISTWYYPAFLTTWPVLKTAESSVTPLWRHRPLTDPKIGLFPTAKPITNFSWKSWTIKHCKIQNLVFYSKNSQIDWFASTDGFRPSIWPSTSKNNVAVRVRVRAGLLVINSRVHKKIYYVFGEWIFVLFCPWGR